MQGVSGKIITKFTSLNLMDDEEVASDSPAVYACMISNLSARTWPRVRFRFWIEGNPTKFTQTQFIREISSNKVLRNKSTKMFKANTTLFVESKTQIPGRCDLVPADDHTTSPSGPQTAEYNRPGYLCGRPPQAGPRFAHRPHDLPCCKPTCPR